MVGIILYGAFELAPYAKKYTDILDKIGEKYDLIGWRRDEVPVFEGENVFMYEGKSSKRYSPVVSKISPAFGFRRFVKSILKKKKYDKLIILTTQSAILLFDVLLFRFKGRYIFDYRDKSYEYIKPYRMLVNGIIKNSKETVISSKWFADNLTDKKDYIITHNFSENSLKYRKTTFDKKKTGEKLTVGYIGALRSFEYHKHLIDCFKNDERFEFHIYGCGDDVSRLKEYAETADNVFVHGAYKESEKYLIIEKFDIMCYNYPYSYVNDGAVANKYYDALIMKKFMFVNPKTKLGKFIDDNNLGVGVSEDGSNISNVIYNAYFKTDAQKFSKTCDYYLEKYISEDTAFYEKIEDALEN